MPISPRPTRDTTGPPRPSVVVFITPAPYRPGPGRYGLRSGEAVDLVHVCARDAERGVVLADGVLVGPVQQAVHLAVGVVVQLDLAHAELVGGAVTGVLADLRDGLGGQLEILVEIHESWHVILLWVLVGRRGSGGGGDAPAAGGQDSVREHR